MKRKFRLTRSGDIKRVRRIGRSYTHPLLVLLVLENELDQARVGVVAGRAVGGAVQRNRAKRLIRAALLAYQADLPAGRDFLILARHPMRDATFTSAGSALQVVLKKAGVEHVRGTTHSLGT